MGKYTKQKAIKVVTECAAKYCNELLDKTLLFIAIDKHGKTQAIEVHFFDRNFAHLTGLVFDKKIITANRFFKMCTLSKLSPADFEFKADGTTFLKLDILPHLMTKNLSANMVGDYNGVGLELYTEKIAGSTRGFIGFLIDDITKKLVPNTILNRDIRENTKKPQNRIIATFRKSSDEKKYSEIVCKRQI